MGKTYRSGQKRDEWRKNRHYEARRKNLREREDRFRFDPNKEYKNEHSKCDQEPPEWAGH